MFFTAAVMAFHHLSIPIFRVCAATVAFSACVFSLSLTFADEVRRRVFFGEEGVPAVALAFSTAPAFCKAAYTAAKPSHWLPRKTAPDTFGITVLIENVFGSIGFAHVADIRYHNVLGAIV